MNDSYLNNKLQEAKDYIISNFGDKHYYSFEDVFSLLKKFGTPFESTLDKVSNYIPSLGNDFTSIETFSKGFIKGDYKIIVLLLDTGFEVFAIGLDKNLFKSYYSLNINDKVLNICYYLETMLNN